VNSANFVNVLKKSPNFQYDNLKKNIGRVATSLWPSVGVKPNTWKG
jgi:hypothetical protein